MLAPRWLWPAAVFLPLAAVAAALVSQHVFEMLPCPWCVLQRVIFVAIALVALLGWIVRGTAPRRVAAGLLFVLAGCGVASALWQHFVATSSVSCNLTLADRIVSALGLDAALPQVFAAWASCADAAVKLLGLPYEFYSLALYTVLAAAALLLVRRPR
jgi:protein dithiol:quinone oxidoreductase